MANAGDHSGGKNHDYHILNPSPWPLLGSVGAFMMAVGAVVLMRSLGNGATAVEAPDPKAVAAAARSFADRLRVRVGALAA